MEENEKRYNTRQNTRAEGKPKYQSNTGSHIEDDSLEDGVISSTESEGSSLFESVEKRQIKLNYIRALSKEIGQNKDNSSTEKTKQ